MLRGGHEDSVQALAAAPDGRWLASAGYDGTVRLWDLIDPAGPRCVRAIEHLPDGNRVCWEDPDDTGKPGCRWTHRSRDAWRWLGWQAPLPDGKTWTLHPMDAFQTPDSKPTRD